MTLTTNEWHRADGEKWVGREVLCKFSDKHKEVATWNGYYWCDQSGRRIKETVAYFITLFYIFEKENENNII